MSDTTTNNTVCHWFEKDAQDAARFYPATFPDSEVTAIRNAPDDFPDGSQGTILSVESTVLGIPCMGVNGGPMFKQSEAVSSNEPCSTSHLNCVCGVDFERHHSSFEQNQSFSR